jgi:hypothetical protein
MGPSDPPPAFHFDAYLKWLKEHGHNFTRGWNWEPTKWDNTQMKNPELANDLCRELDAWRQDVGAEMMQTNPDCDPAAETPKKGKKKAPSQSRE